MATQGGELDKLKGQFVAICVKNALVLGPFETYADAIQAGREQCRSDEFVVMRLLPVKPPRSSS
jgi:hypothetical protein